MGTWSKIEGSPFTVDTNNKISFTTTSLSPWAFKKYTVDTKWFDNDMTLAEFSAAGFRRNGFVITDYVGSASGVINIPAHITDTGTTITSISQFAFERYSKVCSIGCKTVNVIASLAFVGDYGIREVSFPECQLVDRSAFSYCTTMSSMYFPKLRIICEAAFENCSALTNLDLPACETVGWSAFQFCYSISSAFLPVCSAISGSAFANCSKLFNLTVGISLSTVAQLSSNALNGTPFTSSSWGSFGRIYVPSSLVSTYQSASNWSAFASLITAYIS